MNAFNSPEAVILLLDSDPLMRTAVGDALQNAGYLVITAPDVGRAIDRMREIRPDLLMTRPYINSMPGAVAADYLRTKMPGLPVLIVGGFLADDRVDVQNAIKDYHTFPKPFRREDLLATVSEVLSEVRAGR